SRARRKREFGRCSWKAPSASSWTRPPTWRLAVENARGERLLQPYLGQPISAVAQRIWRAKFSHSTLMPQVCVYWHIEPFTGMTGGGGVLMQAQLFGRGPL